MNWKKSFIIAILIASTVFILGYFIATALAIIILFITTVVIITLGVKLYSNWKKEDSLYYYFGLSGEDKLQGLIQAKSKEQAEKLAKRNKIIILDVHLATDEEISQYKTEKTHV